MQKTKEIDGSVVREIVSLAAVIIFTLATMVATYELGYVRGLDESSSASSSSRVEGDSYGGGTKDRGTKDRGTKVRGTGFPTRGLRKAPTSDRGLENPLPGTVCPAEANHHGLENPRPGEEAK